MTPEREQASRPDDTHAGSETGSETQAAAERRRRRKRLAEVFGDVLPDGTGDERGSGWGDRDRGDDGDAWLRGQVPPHHGE